jgi:anti-sigma B factor antagonist
MHLALTERQIGAVTVLDLVGKLTIDHDAQRLKDKINSLIQQGRTQIILNLTDVPYIDSGGLGQLVASFGSVAKTSGGLRLLGVSKRNHDLLSITRLVTLFDAYDSENEAVESFRTHVTVPAVAE